MIFFEVTNAPHLTIMTIPIANSFSQQLKNLGSTILVIDPIEIPDSGGDSPAITVNVM